MVLVGTSGWFYNHWVERFYPPDIPKSAWFSFYARHFQTVEVNSSFYRMPTAERCMSWAGKAPENFVFSVKVFRGITHLKKLSGVEELLKNFFEAITPLKNKLGCILHQLPPSLKKDASLLEDYLSELPRHLLHTVEFRNRSWLDDAVMELLNKHRIAYCIISMPGFPNFREMTADFFYIRMHGSSELYSSCYTEAELSEWASYIKATGLDYGYVYFNNDARAYAIKNARRLIELLKKLSGPRASRKSRGSSS